MTLMKDSAYIINCSRGGVVDENALVDAIEAGKIAGAGLDVFVTEPADNQRVLSCPKIVLTPHLGGATAEAQARIGDEIVEIVQELL